MPEEFVVAMVLGGLLDRWRGVRRAAPRPGGRLPAAARVGTTVAGRAVAASGVALAFRAWRAFGPDRALVVAGPYARTRNPMYLGWALVHLGWAVARRSPGMLLTWPCAVAAVQRTVLREERDLRAALPEAYGRYSADVPRWFSVGGG